MSEGSRPRLRPLEWIGSSRDDLGDLPETVQSVFGFALYRAQLGGKHPDAKPLKGVSGVLEVVDDFDGSTFRAVYTVRFRLAVYVLDVFQKKSTRGIATPKHVLDRVKTRLAAAADHYEVNYARQEDEGQDHPAED
jgi:phage-related protein